MAVVRDAAVIQLEKVHDPRGNLTYIEGSRHIAFDIERAYWIYDVPGGVVRGGHAYLRLAEFMVALSGSFDVVLHDGEHERIVHMNRSYYGLYVPPMLWRHLGNFSTNAVCLILASAAYSEEDYVRDWGHFARLRASSNSA